MLAAWGVTAGHASARHIELRREARLSGWKLAAILKRFSFNRTSFRHQESQEALSMDSGFKHLTGTELISNLIQL